MRFPKSDCPSGKRHYPTERDALDAKKEITLVCKRYGKKLPRAVYKCRFCDGWHLTTQYQPKVKSA